VIFKFRLPEFRPGKLVTFSIVRNVSGGIVRLILAELTVRAKKTVREYRFD